MQRLAHALACFALVAPTLAIAQQAGPPSPLDEIVVTASRVPLPLRRVGVSLTVLNTQDLQAFGNLALQDVLRQTTAIAVTAAGGLGQTASLRVRGEEGFRTLVLLDGIRLLDPSAPQVGPQFEHIMSATLGRVEILRGPQGLGFGADAGGVVNLSSAGTRGGSQFGFDLQRGSYGTRQYGATLGAALARADVTLLASGVDSDGFNAQLADNVLRDDDGYDNSTLHARAHIDLGAGFNAEFARREVEASALFDGCFHPSTFATIHDCTAQYDAGATRAALSHEGESSSHTLAWSVTDTRRDSRALAQSAYASRGKLERWEYLGHLRALPRVALVYGADHERAANNGIGRTNTGVFAEALGEVSPALNVGAGLRADDNQDFGRHTSARLSGAYVFTTHEVTWKLKGSFGTGFRAPSPYEIAYNTGPYAYPPAASTVLREESSRGLEAGLEAMLRSGVRFDAVYFDQQVRDAIQFDLAGFSGYLQETGISSSRGIELSGTAPLTDKLALSANYTWNDTERPDGSPRPRRPRHLLNAGLTYAAIPERLNMHAFYRAARSTVDDSFTGKRVALDDYGVLGVSATWQAATRLQLYARVENLLGEDYAELAGYRAAGRAAYMGVRYGL